MSKVSLMVKFTTKPGKRDELKALWEKYVKPHAAKSDEIEFSCYCFDHQDENSIILFELLRSGDTLQTAYRSDWFKEYMSEMEQLLAGPPMVMTGNPIWIK